MKRSGAEARATLTRETPAAGPTYVVRVAAFAFLAAPIAACGGAARGAQDAGLGDAPTQTAVQATVGGQPFTAESAWANVSNPPANTTDPWVRVVLLDAPGSCDDAAIIPRASATELHLFVLSLQGSPVVPGRSSPHTADAAGL